MTRVVRICALLGMAAALTLPGLDAQSSDEGPALGVARVSLTNGDVSTRRGDSGDWVKASVDSPLVEGDSIATGAGSRAEVQLDYSNLLRLNENSELTVASLGNKSFRVQVARGIVTYSELHGGEADVDIETPQVAVRPRKNGQYRVEVLGAETAVTVRDGEAEIASTKGTETLKNGRTMLIRGTADEPEFRVVNADPRDDWDVWNDRRDDVLKNSDSYRYLSKSISGGADLDRSGNWRYVNDYGYCWFPSVTVGWAPYRYGRWDWIDYYGWTWVSYEPWGWAPYHYGRWYYDTAFGWGWYPGSYRHRYYWSPALVAFFGYGSYGGFNVGIGFGNIGWVPLGPGEPFYPWYGRGYYGHGRGGHYNNTTIYVDNSVNIYNTYRNARHNNGVTVVDARGFSQGLVNNPRSLRDTELRRATLMRGQIPVVPSRESQGQVVRASNQLGNDGTRRTFFTRERGQQTRRDPVSRVPFERQREQMQNSIRAYANNDLRGAGGGSAGAVTRAGAQGQGAAAPGGVRGATATTDTGRGRQGLEDRSGGNNPAMEAGGVRGSTPSRARNIDRGAEVTPQGGATPSENTNTREARTSSPAQQSTSGDQNRGGVRSGATDSGRDNGWRGFGGGASTATRSADPGQSGSASRAQPSRSRDSGIDRSSSSRSVERSASPSPQRSVAPSVSRSPSIDRGGSSPSRSAPADRGGSVDRGHSSPGRSRFTSSPRSSLSAPAQSGSETQFAPPSSSRVSSSGDWSGTLARSRGSVDSRQVSGSRAVVSRSSSGWSRDWNPAPAAARSDSSRANGSDAFSPRSSSRVTSSGDWNGALSRSRSSDSRVSRSEPFSPRTNSRVSMGNDSSFSGYSRSTGPSVSRSRGADPGVFSGRGGDYSPMPSSSMSMPRSRGIESMPSRAPSAGMSRGGFSAPSSGGSVRSMSRGDGGGGFSGGGRSSGGGVRSMGRGRGR